MSNPEQFYFSEKSLAKRWAISFRTLARWRWKGSGPPYMKIGGRVRYHLDNIKKFEEESLCQSKGVNPSSCDKNLSKI
jgi:predicted site-specific integrase-resolvase